MELQRKFFLVLIGTMILLLACNNNSTNSTTEEKDLSEKEEETTTQNHTLEEIKDINVIKTKEDLMNQQGGTILNEEILESELQDEQDQDLTGIETDLHKQLEELTKQTEDPIELEKGLTYLLGSPNYKNIIESLDQFKPNFEQPDLPGAEKQETTVQGETETSKAIILLDASSSMLAQENGKVKMDIAKDAVKRFASVIGQDSELSLVVYGHKGSEADADKVLSCEGIEVKYQMQSYNEQSFGKSLATVESKGWTPLAGAINKATEMSSNLEGPITVYVVSDGVETCDGDPVKAAEDFAKVNENRAVNIIGFGVDLVAEKELQKISTAGKGKYFSAENEEELTKTIEYEWLPSFGELAWSFTKAPGPWEILDEMNRFDDEHQKLYTLIINEKARFDLAMQVLSQKEVLSSERLNELDSRILDTYNLKRDIASQMRTDKVDEINQIADEIKQQVAEWTEEMRKRKEETGDTW